MPARRNGPAARSTLRDNGCGSCGASCPLAGGGEVDQHAAVLDFHRIGRHAVFLEAGLAQAAAAVEFPVVPGADDVIAVEPAVAERSADMIAGVGDRAELSVLDGDGQRPVHRGDAPHRRAGKVLGGADVDPVVIPSHDVTFHISRRASRGIVIAAGVPGGSGTRVDFDDAAVDPHAIGRELLGERRRRAAVRQPVLIAVPGAGDAAVDDAAFADRAVLVGAEIGQRADLRRRRGRPRCARRRAARRSARLVGNRARRADRDPAVGRRAEPGRALRSRQPATRCSTPTVPKPPTSISGTSGVCSSCMMPSATCITTSP